MLHLANLQSGTDDFILKTLVQTISPVDVFSTMSFNFKVCFVPSSSNILCDDYLLIIA